MTNCTATGVCTVKSWGREKRGKEGKEKVGEVARFIYVVFRGRTGKLALRSSHALFFRLFSWLTCDVERGLWLCISCFPSELQVDPLTVLLRGLLAGRVDGILNRLVYRLYPNREGI